jgi:Ca-activated chloride channel homolog
MFGRPLMAAALLLFGASTARAQGWIEIDRPVHPVVLPAPAPSNVLRVSTSVRTRIEGRVAQVEVEEQFRNAGGFRAEGTYLYPLPGEAVFQNFSLWMGETEVRGEMMNAEQARGIYEEIVRRLRDPALLTLEGHGLIRARVFPIQPGETRRVVLRYTQLLPREGDALRLRYAIGERGSLTQGALNTPPGTFADRLSYRVTVPGAEAWGTPYSPTHTITSRRDGDDLVVSLDSSATGDVEIFLPLRRGLVGTSLTAHAPAGEDGYFMLLVSPAQVEDATDALPKDLTLVVDVSGSMSGDKIAQARAALRQALGTLGPQDRFRLVSFSTRVIPFRDEFSPATPDNLNAARTWVDGLVADGGTNIAGALDAALGQSVSQERLPIVVFVTDGVPTVGEQQPDRIATASGAHIGRTRLFTFGVGTDVNTYLLDRLAQEGRGTAQYVAPDASVEQAIGTLMNKVRHPALTNLRIEGAPVDLVQSYPSRLPDVFYGEELVVFGRYHGSASGTLTVVGDRGGRTERFTTQAIFPASSSDNAFIPRLWASRRIGELTRQIRIEGASQALVQEVRDLGLRYGILTEYTSYLVQEPVQTAFQPRDRMMPTSAPAPVEQSGAMAFRSARASSAMMGAGNLASADAAAGARADEIAQGSGRALRRVAGRMFVQDGAVWTDAAHQATLRVVEVAPYSEAYFAMVRALPEIAPFLKVGDEVLVAGRRASIKVTRNGTATWRAGELEGVVRAFRGA